MTLITDTPELLRFCDSVAGADYIAIDTEFLRESTYYPQLCLVQVAGPTEAVAIDPLAPGIDMAPLHALVCDKPVLKVFHSARQDLEIFWHLTGTVPAPIFDTQVAAMVCGFGESVGYEKIVASLAGAKIDKSSRFTDWSRRPLTDKQLTYALADVIHLRPVYEKLKARLERDGRAAWLDEELAVLTAPETYDLDPDQAWQRLKTRTNDRKFLVILKVLAAWREREARNRDVPRNRILRDDALMEIAAHAPKTAAELGRTRGLSEKAASGPMGNAILAGVEHALSIAPQDRPAAAAKRELPAGAQPVVELLKVLLKMSCEEHDVAQKLVANTDDLERIAAEEDPDIPALRGWRRQVFGDAAQQLKAGALALKIEDGRIRALPTGS